MYFCSELIRVCTKMNFCKQILYFTILISVIKTALSSEWSACSKTCGTGVEERTIPCQNVDCDGAQKEYRVCNKMKCSTDDDFQWIVGGNFTPCTQTCGNGTQRSEIYCQEVDTKMKVPNSQCYGLSTEGLTPITKLCEQQPCPSEWQVSDWSSCSKSCGGGLWSRNVTCAQEKDLELDSDQKCDNKTKPVTLQACNNHPCYNHWHSGHWSPCSTSCGNGTQRRNITCMNAHRRKIHKQNCSLLMRPAVERSCTGHSCTYKWNTSDWSNCSMRCGSGLQIRNVNCTKDGRIVEDRLCFENSRHIKPAEQRNCSGMYCSGKWVAQTWNTCEAPNCYVEGNQQRHVFCMFDGEMSDDDDHSKCDPSTKPSNIQSCYKTLGCNPSWNALPWSKCNEKCESRRVIECKVGDTTVGDDRCTDFRPNSFRMCGSECPFFKCLNQFCHLENLGNCEQNCCDSSSDVIPDYFGPLLQYRLFEEQCCKQCNRQ